MSRRGILFRLGLIHLIGPDGPISEDGNLVLGNGEEATLDGGDDADKYVSYGSDIEMSSSFSFTVFFCESTIMTFVIEGVEL